MKEDGEKLERVMERKKMSRETRLVVSDLRTRKGRRVRMTEIKLYDRNKEKRDKEMEKERERERPLKTGLERVSKS